MSEVVRNDDNQGAEDVSLRFSREDFARFLFNYVQSPSEETKVRTTGFDVTKDDLKRLTDKLDYFVERNNRLVAKDFSVRVEESRSHVRKFHSYNEFFTLDIFSNQLASAVSITLSYLIDFNRAHDNSTPERQLVNIYYIAERLGKIGINIRTTEFTWPQQIFLEIDKEIDAVSNSQQTAGGTLFGILSAPAKLLSSDLRQTAARASLNAMFIAILAVLAFGASKSPSQFIYNEQTGEFSIVDFSSLPPSADWREIADDIIRSRVVFKQKDFATFELPDLLQSIYSSMPAFGWVGIAIVAALSWANFREMQRHRLDQIGRIWLSNLPMPRRARPSVFSGVFEAIISSLLASWIFWAMLNVA